MAFPSTRGKDKDRRGDPAFLSSPAMRMSHRLPITGVWDRSKMKSIVLPVIYSIDYTSGIENAKM